MKLIFTLTLLLFSLFSRAQSSPLLYKIYDVKQKKTVELSQIIDAMTQADVLFFGEEHNDSVGHHLETSLLQLLAERFNNKVTLSMEMFHTDIQPVIDEYLAGVISEKNFIKEGRAWNNYIDYKPAVEFAKSRKIRVIGANAAARYSNAVTMKGLEILHLLPKESLKNIAPLPIDTASGRYYDKFIETLGGHSMGDMKIYQTQNFWDATMAWSIHKQLKSYPKTKILHLVGRFHTDEKLGTYAMLSKYNPKIKALNISAFSSEDFKNPDWEKHAHLGDYIILTNPEIKKTF